MKDQNWSHGLDVYLCDNNRLINFCPASNFESPWSTTLHCDFLKQHHEFYFCKFTAIFSKVRTSYGHNLKLTLFCLTSPSLLLRVGLAVDCSGSDGAPKTSCCANLNIFLFQIKKYQEFSNLLWLGFHRRPMTNCQNF